MTSVTWFQWGGVEQSVVLTLTPPPRFLFQESYVWKMYQERCWEFFPAGDCFRKQYEDQLNWAAVIAAPPPSPSAAFSPPQQLLWATSQSRNFRLLPPDAQLAAAVRPQTCRSSSFWRLVSFHLNIKHAKKKKWLSEELDVQHRNRIRSGDTQADCTKLHIRDCKSFQVKLVQPTWVTWELSQVQTSSSYPAAAGVHIYVQESTVNGSWRPPTVHHCLEILSVIVPAQTSCWICWLGPTPSTTRFLLLTKRLKNQHASDRWMSCRLFSFSLHPKQHKILLFPINIQNSLLEDTNTTFIDWCFRCMDEKTPLNRSTFLPNHRTNLQDGVLKAVAPAAPHGFLLDFVWTLRGAEERWFSFRILCNIWLIKMLFLNWHWQQKKAFACFFQGSDECINCSMPPINCRRCLLYCPDEEPSPSLSIFTASLAGGNSLFSSNWCFLLKDLSLSNIPSGEGGGRRTCLHSWDIQVLLIFVSEWHELRSSLMSWLLHWRCSVLRPVLKVQFPVGVLITSLPAHLQANGRATLQTCMLGASDSCFTIHAVFVRLQIPTPTLFIDPREKRFPHQGAVCRQHHGDFGDVAAAAAASMNTWTWMDLHELQNKTLFIHVWIAVCFCQKTENTDKESCKENICTNKSWFTHSKKYSKYTSL